LKKSSAIGGTKYWALKCTAKMGERVVSSVDDAFQIIDQYEKETTTKYAICKETRDFKNLSKLVKMKLRFIKFVNIPQRSQRCTCRFLGLINVCGNSVAHVGIRWCFSSILFQVNYPRNSRKTYTRQSLNNASISVANLGGGGVFCMKFTIRI
jgi:hypothetical protein